MRCVHCGRSKECHTGPELVCEGSAGRDGKRYGTLALPEGKTCGDCFNFKRTCEWLISCKPDRTSCDWYPIRFVQKIQEAPCAE